MLFRSGQAIRHSSPCIAICHSIYAIRCGVLFICFRATPNAYCQINERLHTFFLCSSAPESGRKLYSILLWKNGFVLFAMRNTMDLIGFARFADARTREMTQNCRMFLQPKNLLKAHWFLLVNWSTDSLFCWGL